MLKKFFLLLCLFISAAGVSAQHTPGSWKVLPMSGMDFEEVLDTPERVYYLTGNSLYSYEKEADETIYYTPGSKISDSGIKFLRYNKSNKYLLCVYNNSNIDLIYDDGKVVNLPEIKESNVIMSKAINDVAFGDNRIYVATAFGLVIYDDQKCQVEESGIFNEIVYKVALIGDNVVIIKKDAGHVLYSAPKSGRHNTADRFKKLFGVGSNSIYPVGNDSYITLGTNEVIKYTIDFNTQSYKLETLVSAPGMKRIQCYKDGYYVVSNNGISKIGSDGTLIETTNIPDEFKSQILSFWNDIKSVWAGNTEGIGNYDLSGGTATVMHDKYFPESSKQFKAVFSSDTPDGSEVYFSNISMTEYSPAGLPGGARGIKMIIESYDWQSGKITPRYPTPLDNGPQRILVDPVDPSIVYYMNMYSGLHILKDNKIQRKFTNSNSPLPGNFEMDLVFDNFGNLWLGSWINFPQDWIDNNGLVHPACAYLMLDKSAVDKLRKDLNAEILESEWHRSAFPSSYSSKCDAKMVFSSKSGKAVHILGKWGGTVWGYDTKGTSSTSDDVAFEYDKGFLDQDGNISSPTYKAWIVEDKTGNIWIGTTTGIYIVTDLEQIADGSSTTLNVIRPKVARNDGTNYADYLLASDQILCIAVDSNNRKWIATQGSGLFYVNEDGTEILGEFNKDNSPLASNVITMVACNPNGNDVLIGTPEGLYVYSSDSAPSADDYSSVYAYPNPVRPDYTGWITINGLMDNSLIKIADTQGHVIREFKSEGGMAVWDGCDMAGNRVNSGVYMVYASQNASGDNSGAVTKIVVIN